MPLGLDWYVKIKIFGFVNDCSSQSLMPKVHTVEVPNGDDTRTVPGAFFPETINLHAWPYVSEVGRIEKIDLESKYVRPFMIELFAEYSS